MNDRRTVDTRIDGLVADVTELKTQMAAHMETTNQIRDILASFRVAGAIAKWAAAIAGGCAAVYASFKGVK